MTGFIIFSSPEFRFYLPPRVMTVIYPILVGWPLTVHCCCLTCFGTASRVNEPRSLGDIDHAMLMGNTGESVRSHQSNRAVLIISSSPIIILIRCIFGHGGNTTVALRTGPRPRVTWLYVLYYSYVLRSQNLIFVNNFQKMSALFFCHLVRPYM